MVGKHEYEYDKRKKMTQKTRWMEVMVMVMK